MLFHLKKSFGISPGDPNIDAFNPEVGCIVNKFHFDRLAALLDSIKSDPKAKVVIGGKVNP